MSYTQASAEQWYEPNRRKMQLWHEEGFDTVAQKLRVKCCTNEAAQYLRESLVINSTTQLCELGGLGGSNYVSYKLHK